MNEKEKFGIVITCYRGDIHFTKGLLASIFYFCGNVPICLIVDGDFSIKSLEKTYNIVRVIRKNDVQDDYLRNNCFGTRFSNMVAFFESPFERFLYIDSDTVLWGNILDSFNPSSADFIYNEPHESYTPTIIKQQYFNFDRIFEYTENFEWNDCHFFNSGVFSMKRGIFNIEEVKELRQICKTERSIMPTDVQGLLNTCVFRNFKKNIITVSEAKLQTLTSCNKKEELERTFRIVNGTPLVEQNTVLHWAGLKPFYRQNKIFNEPMNFFRKMNLVYTNSKYRKTPYIYFRFEELKAIYNVYYKNRPIKIILRLLGIKQY